MKTRFFSALQITDDDDDDDDDVDVLKNLFMLPARRSLRFIGDASDVFLEDVEALRPPLSFPPPFWAATAAPPRVKAGGGVPPAAVPAAPAR